ncbi:hypothetical protein F7R05_09290 [Pseudomonas koreensis]|nr:hypothetical protein F7R05_09290 [Pseudomonas koreensis]
MQSLWRGRLLPLGGATVVRTVYADCLTGLGAASHPSGSKLPRHSPPLNTGSWFTVPAQYSAPAPRH